MDKKTLFIYALVGIAAAASAIALVERSMRPQKQSAPAAVRTAPQQPAPELEPVDEEHAAPAQDYEFNKNTGAKQFLR